MFESLLLLHSTTSNKIKTVFTNSWKDNDVISQTLAALSSPAVVLHDRGWPLWHLYQWWPEASGTPPSATGSTAPPAHGAALLCTVTVKFLFN